MLLRVLIVMLIALNLGAAAWWLAAAPASASAAPAGDAGDAPRLRLVGEPSAETVPLAPAGAIAPDVQAPAAVAPAASAAAVPAADAVCLRFGPFADEAARSAAHAALRARGVQALPRDTPLRPVRGWKVVMTPLASREAAVAMAERIKAAGISDLYVLNQGAEANGIALGRYGSEDAARRREAELRGKGFEVQAAPLGNAPAQAWLDARLPATLGRAAVAGIADNRPLDCATLR